ncbi:hypothetical protein ACXWQI_09465, partial [Streptococcus pyogenes]
AWSPPAGFRLIFRDGDGDARRNSDAYPRLLTPTHAIPPAVGEAPPLAAFAATDFRDTLWLAPYARAGSGRADGRRRMGTLRPLNRS